MKKSGQPRGPSDEEVLGYHERLANHGRWGESDKAGTLNHITTETVLAAVSLVRTGVQVSCARPVSTLEGSLPHRNVLHLMTKSGSDNAAEGHGVSADWIGIGIHGTEFTHLDGHAHIFWNGEMYNHRSMSLVRADEGALEGGMEPTFNGIVGRGILMDGPASNGGQPLVPGHGIGPADLDAWFGHVGIEPATGDVLYVRTGNRRTNEAEGFPGLSASCLPWLHEKNIAVLASDAISDVHPSGYSLRTPLHSVGIASMGLWILDNASLDALAAQCLLEERYEFLTIISPIPLCRATGSLVNPIALF